MPELPEVETIRLGLEKYLVGHSIENIEIRLPRLFIGEVQKVQGATVQAVRRYGKGLVIDLSNEYSLTIHVKMTGQLVYRKESKGTEEPDDSKEEIKKVSTVSGKETKRNIGSLPNKHTHVIFHLDKGATLFFTDIRQFGWIKVVKSEEVQEQSFFKNLGPEPLRDLTEDVFRKIIEKGNLPIKVLLMDQKRIAGIGNIYANDALWNAEINPFKKAKELSTKEIKKLYKAVLFVLSEGLKYGGASETNYIQVDEEKGSYQDHFLVYGQTGKPCIRCDELIRRIVLGGRGTFVCSNCQK